MLELRDVKKSFTQPDGTPLHVLDIEDLRAQAGEQVVIVGHSGCGKTTLLHVIAGISRPDSGRATATLPESRDVRPKPGLAAPDAC